VGRVRRSEVGDALERATPRPGRSHRALSQLPCDAPRSATDVQAHSVPQRTAHCISQAHAVCVSTQGLVPPVPSTESIEARRVGSWLRWRFLFFVAMQLSQEHGNCWLCGVVITSFCTIRSACERHSQFVWPWASSFEESFETIEERDNSIFSDPLYDIFVLDPFWLWLGAGLS